ncbi:lipopolysaccharide biosynthesis protein [Aestuariispira ectoiniformans]|uniref:lipopolysaccharide biosynthesis protein n=1 Tax=Aestuariispira ectoiniformans TaxID=2775080 RepID=UPI00223C2C7A|nr:hypothetical protein [Aestuariispira ectoiniformans]
MKVFLSLLILYSGFLASFFLNKFLIKNLALDGLGDFNVGISVAAILSVIAVFGGHSLAHHFVPRYLSEDKWPHICGFIRHHITMAGLSSAAIAVVALGLIGGFAYFEMTDQLHEAVTASLLTPFFAVTLFFGHVIQSMGRPVAALYPYEIMRPLLFWLGCLIWLQIFPDIDEFGAMLMLAVALCLCILVQYVTISRALPVPITCADPAYEKAAWNNTGIPLLWTALTTSFLPRINLLSLEVLHPVEASVGIYTLLLFLPSIIWLNFHAMNAVIRPRIIKMVGNTASLQQQFNQSTQILFACNILTAGIMIVFARPILGWFHKDLLPYEGWLVFLLLSACLSSIAELAGPFLSLNGHHRKSAKLNSGLVAINLVVAPVCVYFFGLEGAICSLVGIRFTRSLASYSLLYRHVTIKPWLALDISSTLAARKGLSPR